MVLILPSYRPFLDESVRLRHLLSVTISTYSSAVNPPSRHASISLLSWILSLSDSSSFLFLLVVVLD